PSGYSPSCKCGTITSGSVDARPTPLLDLETSPIKTKRAPRSKGADRMGIALAEIGTGLDSSPQFAAPRQKTRFHLLAILLFWALIYLPGLAWPPMMDDADSAHAVVAREMLQRHDYVTMYVDGVRYLDKAPLPYWLTAVSYKFLGVSEL